MIGRQSSRCDIGTSVSTTFSDHHPPPPGHLPQESPGPRRADLNSEVSQRPQPAERPWNHATRTSLEPHGTRQGVTSLVVGSLAHP